MELNSVILSSPETSRNQVPCYRVGEWISTLSSFAFTALCLLSEMTMLKTLIHKSKSLVVHKALVMKEIRGGGGDASASTAKNHCCSPLKCVESCCPGDRKSTQPSTNLHFFETESTVHLVSFYFKLNQCLFSQYDEMLPKTAGDPSVSRGQSVSVIHFFLWKTLASIAPEVVSWPILLRNLVLASSPTKLEAMDMELQRK